MKTRKLVALFMALALVLGLGFGASAEEAVKITFWHTYGDQETPLLEDVILPMFYEQHPNIEVEAIRQEAGQFNQMLVTAFGTGVVPDVARVDIVQTPGYANLGGILPLDDMPGFAELKDAVLEGPLSTNYYGGQYYGLPLNTNCKAAVINGEIMASLGIEGTPATMEAFIAASEKAKPGEWTINVSGVGAWDLYPYFWLFGGVLTDEAFTQASGYMDGEQSVAALAKMKELHDAGTFTIRDIDGSPDAWDGINSEYAMFLEGPWYPFPEDGSIYPAVIPSYNGVTSSVVGGENIVLFAGSDKQEAAWTFLQFMLTEEVQLKLLEVGVIPTLKACVESEQVQSDPKWSVYMEQLTYAQSRIPSPQDSTIDQLWADAMNMIFMDGMDIQEVMTETAQMVDAELAK